MKKKTLGGIVLMCAAGLATAQAAPNGPQFVEVPGSMEFSGRLIVKPLQPADLAARGMNGRQITTAQRNAQAVLANYQLHSYEALVDHHMIVVPAGMTENALADQLMKTGLFDFAEPDWILYPIACPNDSRFGSQWHHSSSLMQSCEAWDIHTGGNSVTVAICDTGVQTSHPDFSQNRVEGYNAVDRLWESQGGSITPVHPHGTQTTGCAAANGNDGSGVTGVGWDLGHRMMRVSNSSTGSASLSTLTHAALTAVQSGDRVANVSYSGVTSSSVRSTATQIKNLGGLLTWSAGNNSANLNWGSRDSDDVIVVGATTANDGRASFSAYGPSVDLFAPGQGVYTTSTNSGFASVNGTSFSAPLTAGLIGLIWSADPSLTPDEVEAILKNGCDDVGASGIDNTYGYGRINSYQSLLLIDSGTGNTAPSVSIASPNNGSSFTEGDVVVFSGSANDYEDGDLSGSIAWTSNIDGNIGSGAAFNTTALSVGTHTITARVTDSGNASNTDTVSVTIQQDAGSVPNAPDGLSAIDLGNRRSLVSWNDNSNNETSFTIERESLDTRRNRWRRYTSYNVGANTTSDQDRPNTGTHRYRIRANNAAGSSAWTGWVQVTVTR